MRKRLCANEEDFLLWSSQSLSSHLLLCEEALCKLKKQNYTKYDISCHQFYFSCSMSIVNRPCSVTNTKCKLKITGFFFFGHELSIQLQRGTNNNHLKRTGAIRGEIKKKCPLNIICYPLWLFFWYYRSTILQLLSLATWLFIQVSIIHDKVSLQNCLRYKIYQTSCSIIGMDFIQIFNHPWQYL